MFLLVIVGCFQEKIKDNIAFKQRLELLEDEMYKVNAVVDEKYHELKVFTMNSEIYYKFRSISF